MSSTRGTQEIGLPEVAKQLATFLGVSYQDNPLRPWSNGLRKNFAATSAFYPFLHLHSPFLVKRGDLLYLSDSADGGVPETRSYQNNYQKRTSFPSQIPHSQQMDKRGVLLQYTITIDDNSNSGEPLK
ncbi:hypothetical protein TIFTF001_043066 [Ficus carica]|uniref:Uncharacterized protein n=1 Tax=Ficus carica TaxID=3494 RepID=A0AA87YRX8_FICCA|nr:hypothetical protein TIFTF001_043066 [Ficus carica]